MLERKVERKIPLIELNGKHACIQANMTTNYSCTFFIRCWNRVFPRVILLDYVMSWILTND